jgi:hypothetical protein
MVVKKKNVTILGMPYPKRPSSCTYKTNNNKGIDG